MKKKILIIGSIVGVLLITLSTVTFLGGNLLDMVNRETITVFAAQDVEPDPKLGLIVTSVVKGGPSDEAGIVRGDILFRIDGLEVNSMGDLLEIMADHDEGDEVDLTILHGDDVLSLTVTIAEGTIGGQLGLSLCCGSTSEKEIVVFELDRGKPLIIRIVDDGPADKAGLKVGDLILKMDGKKLDKGDNFAELIREYKPGDQIELEIERIETEETIVFTIELGEHPEEEDVAYLGVHIIKAPGILSLPLGEGNLEEYQFNFGLPHDDWFLPWPRYGDGSGSRIRPHLDSWVLPLMEGDYHSGIVIHEIISESPAAEAGLQAGDLIVSLDGKDFEDPEQFMETIGSNTPGEEILLTIYRDSLDNSIEIHITLDEHPDKPGAGYLGIKIGAMFKVDQTECRSRLDRWMPHFEFDRFTFPFQFEWRFDLPNLKEV